MEGAKGRVTSCWVVMIRDESSESLAASSCRACSWPTESLVDSAWQSVSKITLDLPWRPARAGRQEERESKREERERGRGRRKNETNDQAGPATMTSRAL